MGADAKRHYPVFLDLVGRLTIIVGSGRAAERKALQLSRYGADVTIITASPSDEIIAAEGDGKLLVESRDYVSGDLAGAALVMCLTADDEVRRAVATEARKVGCPVNVAGAPGLSSFLVPGVVHRQPLQIAVSTGGLSPELAKRVRRIVGETFGDEWEAYASLVVETRALADEQFTDSDSLATFMDALLDADILGRMQAGEELAASALVDEFVPQVGGDVDGGEAGVAGDATAGTLPAEDSAGSDATPRDEAGT